MALVLVEASADNATVAFAAEQLGVQPADIDSDYGLLPIDPVNGLYSVLVRADALPAGFENRKPYRGPFSNPRIEPL